MNNTLYLILGGFIGFYLAQNKEKETILFLKNSIKIAKKEAESLKLEVEKLVEK